MFPFNRGQLSDAIMRAFGMKGRVPMMVDELLSVSAQVFDISNSPYLRYGITCQQFQTRAGVVGERSHVWAQPGANKALQLLQISVTNSGAAVDTFQLCTLTAAAIASIGVDDANQFKDVAGNPFALSLSSSVNDGTVVGSVGGSVAQFAIPAASTLVITLPLPGVILFGDDENGMVGYGVRSTGDNVTMHVGFYAKEWPLPG